MQSAIATISLTPADLEARLASLGIPVARLIGAARIARSTWSAWRAGRTRPRSNRWAATTAAFDALVAEATPAPAGGMAEAGAAGPVRLTGSSTPTGASPSFVPVATALPESADGGRGIDAVPHAGVPSIDPIVTLRSEWLARRAAFDSFDHSEGDEDVAYGRISAVERQVVAARATTLAGAIASLEWARDEFAEYKNEGILGDRLILALIKGALGILQRGNFGDATPASAAEPVAGVGAATFPTRRDVLAVVGRYRAALTAYRETDSEIVGKAFDQAYHDLRALSDDLAIHPARTAAEIALKAEVAAALDGDPATSISEDSDRVDYEIFVLGHAGFVRSIIADARRLDAPRAGMPLGAVDGHASSGSGEAATARAAA